MTRERTLYLPSLLLVLAGLWLIASPWVLGEASGSDPGVLSMVGGGVLITLLAAGNLWVDPTTRVLSGLIVVLGLWMMAAPLVLGYASHLPWTWSSVIAGVVVVALAVVDVSARTVASVPSALARMVHGPWIGRHYVPAFAYEYEDFPVNLLARWRDRMGSEPGAWQGEFRGVGPRGWRRPDEDILDEVCARMADHAHLNASDIDVTVSGGEVTLQGTVSSRAARRMAETIADSVSGVRDVDNQLRVPARDAEIRRAA
jgi:hypothetical protein